LAARKLQKKTNKKPTRPKKQPIGKKYSSKSNCGATHGSVVFILSKSSDSCNEDVLRPHLEQVRQAAKNGAWNKAQTQCKRRIAQDEPELADLAVCSGSFTKLAEGVVSIPLGSPSDPTIPDGTVVCLVYAWYSYSGECLVLI